jgi:formamidopyrimidine-DNA glycosylase
MPELPDIMAYLSALETRVMGQPLERIAVPNSGHLLSFLFQTLENTVGLPRYGAEQRVQCLLMLRKPQVSTLPN